MLSLLRQMFAGRRNQAPVGFERPHLDAPARPAAIYAIGDIHGCAVELALLEQAIVADAAGITGEKWIVCLGDYVDRGPNSAGVLDALIAAPPAGFKRICLAGNHEIMMQAFIANPAATSDWLDFGGLETLQSYGITTLPSRARSRGEVVLTHIPPEHVEFLKNLPLTLSVPGLVFVHAGLRPGIPVEEQSETDLLWIRNDFFNAPPVAGRIVVHGHTPAAEPVVAPGRICVDTGAFATGRLTAARFVDDQPLRFITAQQRSTP